MLRFVRRPEVCARVGKPTSSLYDLIAACLFTKPVPLGGTSVGWPDHEVDVLCAARLAMKSDSEIRALVAQLEAKRPELLTRMQLELDLEPDQDPLPTS